MYAFSSTPQVPQNANACDYLLYVNRSLNLNNFSHNTGHVPVQYHVRFRVRRHPKNSFFVRHCKLFLSNARWQFNHSIINVSNYFKWFGCRSYSSLLPTRLMHPFGLFNSKDGLFKLFFGPTEPVGAPNSMYDPAMIFKYRLPEPVTVACRTGTMIACTIALNANQEATRSICIHNGKINEEPGNANLHFDDIALCPQCRRHLFLKDRICFPVGHLSEVKF